MGSKQTKKDKKNKKKEKKRKAELRKEKRRKARKKSSSSSSSSSEDKKEASKPVLDSGISQEIRAILQRRASLAAQEAREPGSAAVGLDLQRDNAMGLHDARKDLVVAREETLSEAMKEEQEAHKRQAEEILQQHRDMRRRATGPCG
eukprot:TRINITY_DN33837_c0_g1_i1.p2 TRINITY_DN33837_c0_g1~~TRINITY_DN33837_c0_g1_i1.p2  ORF type:complete len:147 (+),score=41.73 TRINITY_DN33837_c0_g1_i1:39-479(+)